MKINKKGLMTLSFLQIASYFLLIESISVLRSTSFDSVVVISKSGEAIRRRHEPLRCVRPHLPRRRPARSHRETLVAPFGAGRNVDAV